MEVPASFPSAPGHSHSSVSILTPCYNEERSIGALLEAVAGQTFPAARIELIVSDGLSTDRTRQVIEAFAARNPGMSLRVIDNPERSIPAALNRGLREATAEVVVRLDAHSIPAEDYVERCLETLETTGAANVGGVWEIRPGGTGWMARAIARAVSHPLGAGDARYRISGEAGPVDTVPFGAFPKTWLERVGGYNEDLLTNEDYELNVRLRRLGGVIWFDPSIRSAYIARSSLSDLARQYFRYGFWKARMLRLHPLSLRWRQALPPLFVLLSLFLAAAAPFAELAAQLLALEWTAYLAGLALAGLLAGASNRAAAHMIGIPAALATVHLSWGGGFWLGLVSGIFHGAGRKGVR